MCVVTSAQNLQVFSKHSSCCNRPRGTQYALVFRTFCYPILLFGGRSSILHFSPKRYFKKHEQYQRARRKCLTTRIRVAQDAHQVGASRNTSWELGDTTLNQQNHCPAIMEECWESEARCSISPETFQGFARVFL